MAVRTQCEFCYTSVFLFYLKFSYSLYVAAFNSLSSVKETHTLKIKCALVLKHHRLQKGKKKQMQTNIGNILKMCSFPQFPYLSITCYHFISAVGFFFFLLSTAVLSFPLVKVERFLQISRLKYMTLIVPEVCNKILNSVNEGDLIWKFLKQLIRNE